MPFVFDRDYKNVEQVRPFFPAYKAVLDGLTAEGRYPYNDSFKGKIDGIEGPDEDAAIYLLQKMRDLDALTAKVEQYLAEGGREITHLPEGVGRKRYASVVHFGFYVGGTGWNEWTDARLCARENGGKPFAVLPKGQRINGHSISHRVLVKEA